MSANDWWYKYVANANSTGSVTISNDPKYTFGFTGWTPATWGEWVDDLDPFEVFVRETRKEAGLEVSPPRQKWVQNKKVTSQTLFIGTISVPAPKMHYQIKNWSSETDDRIGKDRSNNDSVYTAEDE